MKPGDIIKVIRRSSSLFAGSTGIYEGFKVLGNCVYARIKFNYGLLYEDLIPFPHIVKLEKSEIKSKKYKLSDIVYTTLYENKIGRISQIYSNGMLDLTYPDNQIQYMSPKDIKRHATISEMSKFEYQEEQKKKSKNKKLRDFNYIIYDETLEKIIYKTNNKKMIKKIMRNYIKNNNYHYNDISVIRLDSQI